MNTIIRTISIAALALTSFAASQSFAQDKSKDSSVTKITVNGMVCTFCAQGIEKRLTEMPQTQEVYVDLKQKTVLAQAKSGQAFDNAKLKSEIEDAGYEVVKIEPSAKTIAAYKADAKVDAKTKSSK
jgi:copper chaperone CopZ